MQHSLQWKDARFAGFLSHVEHIPGSSVRQEDITGVKLVLFAWIAGSFINSECVVDASLEFDSDCVLFVEDPARIVPSFIAPGSMENTAGGADELGVPAFVDGTIRLLGSPKRDEAAGKVCAGIPEGLSEITVFVVWFCPVCPGGFVNTSRSSQDTFPALEACEEFLACEEDASDGRTFDECLRFFDS